MASYWIYGLILISIYVIKQLVTPGHNRIKYTCKDYLVPVLGSVFGLACIPIFMISPRNVRNAVILSYLIRHISKILGIKWQLRNGHILAEERGCIIVANHRSALDMLGMFMYWKLMGKCSTITKKETMYFPPFGLTAYLCGAIFVDRSNPKDSYKKLEMAKKMITEEKTKIWFFPEGTRNKKPGLLPFKKGAFKLAVETQVPIIPVVFSPYYFMNEKTSFFGEGKMIMSCLEPISTAGLKDENIPELIERTQIIMEKHYRELYKEVVDPLPKNYPLNLDRM